MNEASKINRHSETRIQSAEGGWLVERDSPAWYLIASCDGRFGWSPIPADGLRFARKEDGEAIRRIVKDAERVCFHDWVSAPEARAAAPQVKQ